MSENDETPAPGCKEPGEEEMRDGLVRAHLAFMQGKLDGPEMIDDIEFYSVGRNSSHYFYLGLKGTQVYYRTVGFTVGDELEDTYRPIDTLSGLYLGHY